VKLAIDFDDPIFLVDQAIGLDGISFG